MIPQPNSNRLLLAPEHRPLTPLPFRRLQAPTPTGLQQVMMMEARLHLSLRLGVGQSLTCPHHHHHYHRYHASPCFTLLPSSLYDHD